MKIAVEGCAHGELDKIYDTVRQIEQRENIKVDLLICCGDFQAVRNYADLTCMACPEKFRSLGTFYQYYSGEKVAPMLTLFIGGNHEASSYLAELPYGGWVAPRIYYIGYAGVVKFGGIRIAGLSGIFKGHDYLRGRFERPPYSGDTMRSVYHIRSLDVFRLRQLSSPDIMISHDWPCGVTQFGDREELFRWKPYFREEANRNELGSRPAQELLNTIKPKHWFSAHLHVRFTAHVPHDDGSVTRFLALDKCLPRRKFLEVVDIECDSELAPKLEYDAEWLSILISTDNLSNTTPRVHYMPGPNGEERWDFHPTEAELEAISKMFGGDFSIPENFSMTAAPHVEGAQRRGLRQPPVYHNPQTAKLCQLLQITNLNALFATASPSFANSGEKCNFDGMFCVDKRGNPDEISLDFEDEEAASCGSTSNDKEPPSNGNSFSCMADDNGANASVEPMWQAPKFKPAGEKVETPDQPPCQVNSEPPKKQFKRRNQEIYAARTSDSEDN